MLKKLSDCVAAHLVVGEIRHNIVSRRLQQPILLQPGQGFSIEPANGAEEVAAIECKISQSQQRQRTVVRTPTV